jgi:protein-tyrosine kinase
MAEADPSPLPRFPDMHLDRLNEMEPDKTTLRAHNIVGHLSSDPNSRPFNLMRTRLLKEADERGARLIGITSPAPGSGKSFLALNLAVSLARLGDRSICLVDLDLRRASVAELLGLEVVAGVEGFLDGSITRLEEVGLSTKGLPLAVFPTRVVTTSSAEYLTGDRFTSMVKVLRDCTANSLVICDLPPVFANDDAMIAMESLDGYLLVIDSGKTTRDQTLEAIQMLQPSPCLGTVLNRYKGSVMDPYGYGSTIYGRYY